MEDLTGRVMSNLVPSSMHGGNTTADDRQYSMSAPGSDSVLPVPDRMDHLPLPNFTNGTAIPVGHPGQQQHVSTAHPDDGAERWSEVDLGGRRWRQM